MLMLSERAVILKTADLLSDMGPQHLVGLTGVAQEIEIFAGDTIYRATDAADALYLVVEGRVRLTKDEQPITEVVAGEAFGTWSLVDDSERGHHAECVQDGVALALHREEFYNVAARDLTLLQEVVRAIAKRLRALLAERSVMTGGMQRGDSGVNPLDPEAGGGSQSLSPDPTTHHTKRRTL